MIAVMPKVLNEGQDAGAQLGQQVMLEVIQRHKDEIDAAAKLYHEEHPPRRIATLDFVRAGCGATAPHFRERIPTAMQRRFRARSKKACCPDHPRRMGLSPAD
jgi:hypothetical protein